MGYELRNMRYNLYTLLELCPLPLDFFHHAKKSPKSNTRTAQKHGQDTRDTVSAAPLRYPSYISLREALGGIVSGRYKVGVLRVPKGRSDDAYISNENSDEPDYLVQGRINRNRAVHRDTVAFEVLPKESWAPVQHAYSSFYQSEDDETDVLKDNSCVKRLHPTVRVVHVLEFDGKDRCYNAVLRENKIFDSRCKDSMGTSNDEAGSSTFTVQCDDRYVKAVPFDKRIPWILIPITDLAQWVKVPGDINAKSLFKVQMTSWNCHNSLPLGCLKGVGENLNEYEMIEKIMMEESGLESHMKDFSEAVKHEVKLLLTEYHKTFEYQVSQRRDFRNRDIRVLTIDPCTARDLDDAIHIRIDSSVSPPEFEIGVHIADVSHFVTPCGPIDNEARNRCTTIYLPRLNFPMLPRELCNDLCSLNPYEDKLTFSVVFFVDSKGNLLKNKPVWFGRSVIRSVARFNYDEVQKVLDHFSRLQKQTASYSQNPLECWAAMESVRPDTCDKQIWPEVWSDLVLLESVTQQMRQRRSHKGSLTLYTSHFFFDYNRYLLSENLKENIQNFISFQADMDHKPIDEATNSAHNLIEELMLLTNLLVAEKIYNSVLSDYSILRHHPRPKTFEFAQFIKFINHFEIFETSNTIASLHQLLRDIKKRHGSFIELSIEHLFMKCLLCATYIVSEKALDRQHFALNFDLYTHFTSPIRRYPDIMVHRLLHALLLLEWNNKPLCDNYMLCEDPSQKEAITTWVHKTLNKNGISIDLMHLRSQCALSNTKRLQAKEVSEGCSLQFFLLWLTRMHECVPTLGSVITLQKRRLNAFLPLLNSTCFLHFQQFEPEDKGKQNGIENRKNIPEEFLNSYCPPRCITQEKTCISILWDVPKEFLNRLENASNSGDHRTYTFSTTTFEETVMILGPLPLYIVPLDTIPRTFTVLPIPPWSKEFVSVLLDPLWLPEKKRKELRNSYIQSTKTGKLDLGGFQPKHTSDSFKGLDIEEKSKTELESVQEQSSLPTSTKQRTSLPADQLKPKHSHGFSQFKAAPRAGTRSRRRSKQTSTLRATERIIQFNITQRSEKSNTQSDLYKSIF